MKNKPTRPCSPSLLSTHTHTQKKKKKTARHGLKEGYLIAPVSQATIPRQAVLHPGSMGGNWPRSSCFTGFRLDLALHSPHGHSIIAYPLSESFFRNICRIVTTRSRVCLLCASQHYLSVMGGITFSAF